MRGRAACASACARVRAARCARRSLCLRPTSALPCAQLFWPRGAGSDAVVQPDEDDEARNPCGCAAVGGCGGAHEREAQRRRCSAVARATRRCACGADERARRPRPFLMRCSSRFRRRSTTLTRTTTPTRRGRRLRPPRRSRGSPPCPAAAAPRPPLRHSARCAFLLACGHRRRAPLLLLGRRLLGVRLSPSPLSAQRRVLTPQQRVLCSSFAGLVGGACGDGLPRGRGQLHL